MKDFDVTIRRGDGYVTVELEGKLGLSGAAHFDTVVRPLTGQYDAPQVTFDCARLSLLDSHGMHALVRIAEIMRPTGRSTIQNAPPELAEMLELAGFEELFELEDHAPSDA